MTIVGDLTQKHCNPVKVVFEPLKRMNTEPIFEASFRVGKM